MRILVTSDCLNSFLSAHDISSSEVVEITRAPEIPEPNFEKEYIRNPKKKEKKKFPNKSNLFNF